MPDGTDLRPGLAEHTVLGREPARAAELPPLADDAPPARDRLVVSVAVATATVALVLGALIAWRLTPVAAAAPALTPLAGADVLPAGVVVTTTDTTTPALVTTTARHTVARSSRPARTTTTTTTVTDPCADGSCTTEGTPPPVTTTTTPEQQNGNSVFGDGNGGLFPGN